MSFGAINSISRSECRADTGDDDADLALTELFSVFLLHFSILLYDLVHAHVWNANIFTVFAYGLIGLRLFIILRKKRTKMELCSFCNFRNFIF